MKVNQWFNDGCNYKEGVALYSLQKNFSKNLLRLFLRSESKNNIEKLKYELGKYKEKGFKKVSTDQKKIINSKEKVPAVKTLFFYNLNELHVDLHPLAMEQRNNFQLAVSSKLQLNNLLPDQEAEALKLCIKIEDLFDSIEATQRTLNYYKKHKIVLDIKPKSFEDLSPAKLIIARNNKRIQVSKYEKRFKLLKEELPSSSDLNTKNKRSIALERCEKKLIQYQLELQQITDLINVK